MLSFKCAASQQPTERATHHWPCTLPHPGQERTAGLTSPPGGTAGACRRGVPMHRAELRFTGPLGKGGGQRGGSV